MKAKASRRVYGFGETVLDIIFRDGQPVTAKPGGSVLNAFVSLGRLGWNPRFISEYATDDVGRLIDSYLAENGVNTAYVNRYGDGKSALAIAFLDRDGNASYSFYKDFPEKRLEALPDELDRRDLIVFGSIYAGTPEVRDSVLRFLETGRKKGALILYDPNFRKAHLADLEEMMPRILENINYADIIRGSDEDFDLIFGLGEPEKVAARIATGSRILLYTQNSREVHVFKNNICLRVPAEPIEPVSTIGAGDNFNAGVVHYLLRHGIERADLEGITAGELEGMARTGIRFASHVCMHYDNYISREFADALSTG